MSDVDKAKLDKMWEKIIAYEKSQGLDDTDKNSVAKIKDIIDEVMKECL